MGSTVFISHSPAQEHITAPTLPSSLPAQILAFLQMVTLTNMRREHRPESLHNQDALGDQDRGTLSFIYTPDLDFISLYRNNARSSLSMGQEVFLQRGAELLQQQLYSCYNLHVIAHKDNSIQSITPSSGMARPTLNSLARDIGRDCRGKSLQE